ncbi:MAG: Spy/CpxP family protein refolding chaperone [Pseudomonadota bacterium]
MKRRVAVITATSLLVLVTAFAAYAGPGCCGMGFGPGASLRGMWNELSADQQKQAEALRLEFFKKVESFRADLGKKRIEIMELASKDSVDEEALQKKREEIWAVKDAMRNERRAMGTKMRSLLTPEQRKKVGPLGRFLPGDGDGPGGGYGPCGGQGFRGGNGPGGPSFGGGRGFQGGCPWGAGGDAT